MEALARFDEALRCYDRAIDLDSRHPEFFNNRGNALARLGRLDEAIRSYDRAIAMNPGYSDAILNRGIALAAARRYEDALVDFERVVSAGPPRADALLYKADALAVLKRFEQALESYDQAVALDPGNAMAFNNRGNALVGLARRYDALDSYERALALRPDYPEALFNRGDALTELGRMEDALASYERAMVLVPDPVAAFPYALGTIAHTRLCLCDWTEYEETRNSITDRCLDGEKVLVPFNAYTLSDSAELQFHCARNFVRDQIPAPLQPAWKGEHYQHDRIRIGYVSFDFREHLLAHQIAGVIEHHDRSRFETVAFSLYPKAPGAIQTRLRAAFERFSDVSHAGDLEIARLVRDQEIDILVDLMGHTRNARMGVFALRPAPVQVNFNCPGTTGADFIDYIVTDSIVVPREHHRYFSERVVYLPETFQPNDSIRPRPSSVPTRHASGLPERGFVFCSFNTSYKFRPEIFDVWIRLLRRFEDSVLWLGSENPTVIHNLRREAEIRGVKPGRLVFAPREKRLEDHLARLQLADIFLDTLPYCAQTTASDALWSGLPVLTCLGGALSGRVTASLLRALDLPDLITESLSEYEQLAGLFAAEPARLQEVRARLAANRSTQPLFDTARYTRHLEAAFERMWQMAGRGEAPRAFAVEPLSRGSISTR